MRSACVVMILLALAALPAAAQLSSEYADWADGPQGWLLTDAERAQFEALSSDDEARDFIELFWAKRDPDLSTRVNEFRMEFEGRVQGADNHWTQGDTPGSLTDRGKTLILMGAPTERFEAGIDAYLSDLYGRRPGSGDQGASDVDGTTRLYGVTFDRFQGRADVWRYDVEQLPESIEKPKRASVVEFAFFDHNGTGEFKHETLIRRAETAQEVLAAMPPTLIRHPDMTALPVFPLLPDAPAASDTQLAWFDQDPAPWPEGAAGLAIQGVATAQRQPAWIAVVLPPQAPVVDLAVGRLADADGDVAGTFQVQLTGLDTQHGRLYELSVPAPAGKSSLALALASAGAPVAIRTFELELAELSAGEAFITAAVAGAEIQEKESFDAGEPFVFGGYHLVPRPEGRYDYAENLDFFALIARPGLGDDGQPKATIKRRVYFGKNRIFHGPPEEAQLSEVAPNVFMCGSQIPLQGFPKEGEYTFKLIIEDAVSGAERTTELPIVLPAKE